MKKKKLKILSLFAGAGGLDLGFEKAGFKLYMQMNMINQYGRLMKIIIKHR